MVTRRLRFLAATLAVVVPLLAVASVAFPALYVHPFKPQSPEGLSWALSVRDASPRLTIVLAAVAVLAAATLWRGSRRLVKVGLGLSVMLASATVALSRFNQFEAMFAPLPQPTFAKVSDVDYLEPGDAVLAVEDQGDAVAFPVRLLAFHHVVHADVGGESVVATYCTLCHAGLVWRSTLDGRALTFRLSGINNQNMMMKDEQTGSWWQQVSGEAIHGPMIGRRLREMPFEELSFATWRTEHPGGRVLRPSDAPNMRYAKSSWEERMAEVPVVTPVSDADPLPPRAIVLGIVVGSESKAYPRSTLDASRVVLDVVGGVPIAVVTSDDGRSVRAFDRRVAGRTLELSAQPGASPLLLVDSETVSTWDFAGDCIAGELRGQRLARVPVRPDYWFDWHQYHPATSVVGE